MNSKKPSTPSKSQAQKWLEELKEIEKRLGPGTEAHERNKVRWRELKEYLHAKYG